jgi:AraC-like DNA-binding protein
MTGFAGWYDAKDGPYREILFYTPFVHGLFIGPVLYFYVKSITNFRFRFKQMDFIHFVPGVLYLLWCIVVVVVDKIIVGDYYLMNGEEDPDFQVWYQWLQRISIIMYLILSVRYFRQYKSYSLNEFSFADLAGLKWLQNFLIAFGVLTILPLLKEILSLIPVFSNLHYVGSWYYFFLFAVVVYYIAINGYNAVVIPLHKLLFEPKLLTAFHRPFSLPAPENGITDAEFELVSEAEPELEKWKQNIEHILEEQRLFEDEELTLTQLSKHLSSNPSFISKVINEGFGKNFNDFINGYRVGAVMGKLQAGEHKTQTLQALAFDCGFNSKATFNRAFKKHTGLSPSEWMQRKL